MTFSRRKFLCGAALTSASAAFGAQQPTTTDEKARKTDQYVAPATGKRPALICAYNGLNYIDRG